MAQGAACLGLAAALLGAAFATQACEPAVAWGDEPSKPLLEQVSSESYEVEPRDVAVEGGRIVSESHAVMVAPGAPNGNEAFDRHLAARNTQVREEVPITTDAKSPNAETPKGTGQGAEDKQEEEARTAAERSAAEYGMPTESPLFGGLQGEEEPLRGGLSGKDKDDKGDSSQGEDAQGAGKPTHHDDASSEVPPEDDKAWLEQGNAVNPQQLPDSSFIYDTSILDLSTADPYYNNQPVQVTGEVIGDNISASWNGRYRWITLSTEGDSATISVYTTEEAAAKIDTYGRYGVRGTTLQVRGIFHLVCQDHDGISDLHSEVVTVVEPGEYRFESFSIRTFVPGAFLVLVGGIMILIYKILSERRR